MKYPYENIVSIDSINGAYGWLNENGQFLISNSGTNVRRGLLKSFISLIGTYGFLFNYKIFCNDSIDLEEIITFIKESKPADRPDRQDLFCELSEKCKGQGIGLFHVEKSVFMGSLLQVNLRHKLEEAKKNGA